MKLKNEDILHNDRGFSLVEVIASILLLTIILLSFFTLFIQSNKTKQTSSEIVDATYIAQIEMEKIYAISKNYPYATKEEIIEFLDDPNKDDDYDRNIHLAPENSINFTNSFMLEKIDLQSGFLITLKISKTSNTLVNIIVNVWDGEILRSNMETTLRWAVTL